MGKIFKYKTYPIKTTIKLIKRELGGLNFSIDFDDETNTIFIKLKKNYYIC